MSDSRFLWELSFLFKDNFEQREIILKYVWKRIIMACYVCLNAICVRKVGQP